MLQRPIYAYVCASPASYLEQVAVHAIVYLVDVYRGNHKCPYWGGITSTAANFAPSPCIMHNKENING